MHTHTLLLLIEPVWNRNFIPYDYIIHAGKLLIEPVWNRNEIFDFNVTGDYSELLIEPVWNRNKCPFGWVVNVAFAFNRTSVE